MPSCPGVFAHLFLRGFLSSLGRRLVSTLTREFILVDVMITCSIASTEHSFKVSSSVLASSRTTPRSLGARASPPPIVPVCSSCRCCSCTASKHDAARTHMAYDST